MEPYKLFPGIGHTRYNEKRLANMFFSPEEETFFSKIFVYSDLLSVTKLIP